MVWEGIQTLGFRNILERLACLSPTMPLSQPLHVADLEASEHEIVEKVDFNIYMYIGPKAPQRIHCLSERSV